MNEEEYLDLCDEFGGDGGRAAWHLLRTLIRSRQAEGWYFEVINPEWKPEATWCFGLAGASRLQITAEKEGYALFVSEKDRTFWFSGIDDLTRWLDEHEGDYAGFTPLQGELFSYLLSVEVAKWASREGL